MKLSSGGGGSLKLSSGGGGGGSCARTGMIDDVTRLNITRNARIRVIPKPLLVPEYSFIEYLLLAATFKS